MSNRASNRAAREAAAAQDARDYRFSCTALKITGGVGAVATLVSLWLTIRVWTEGQMATLTRFVPVMVVIASVYIVGLCVRRYRALTASGHVRGWREDMPDDHADVREFVDEADEKAPDEHLQERVRETLGEQRDGSDR